MGHMVAPPVAPIPGQESRVTQLNQVQPGSVLPGVLKKSMDFFLRKE